MSINCPRCFIPMRNIQVSSVELDICDSCEGIWFDMEEMEQVLKMGQSQAAESSLSPSFDAEIKRSETPGMGELKCPRCENLLFRYHYMISSGIIIDGCENGCGIWLDDGEIRKIFDYTVESEKELDPETEKRLMAELKAIEMDAKMKEEKFIDGLVLMDNRPGLMKYPGKLLQLIYKRFYKLGL